MTEFDKSKIYTAVNADELKIGSKVFVAKNLHSLHDQFCANNVCTLTEIRSEDYQDRFISKFDFGSIEAITPLVYLISEPVESAGLKWTDLKVGDIITDSRTIAMVTAIDKKGKGACHILAGSWIPDAHIKDYEKLKEYN